MTGERSVQELRGKEIAITSRAGVVKRTAELILQRNGMNPEGDTTLIATGNNNNALGALLSGNVAAAVHASCNFTSAACKRDFTVPTGISRMSAMSRYFNPW